MLMNVTDWPLQMMLDKFCKNRCWQVMSKRYDVENKRIVARCMINADSSEVHTADYDEICKEFGWKSFDLTPDMQTVLPVPDPDSFYNDPKVQRIKYDKDGNPIIKRARKSKKNSDVK